jgi:hypothetical protein
MDTALALGILVGLGVVLLWVRRSAKLRRKRLIENRERARRKRPTYKPQPMMSSRTEMRAYDDPSTLAGEITTRGSPTTTQNPAGGAVTSARVTDRPGLRTGSEVRASARGATGKGSPANGKSRE